MKAEWSGEFQEVDWNGLWIIGAVVLAALVIAVFLIIVFRKPTDDDR